MTVLELIRRGIVCASANKKCGCDLAKITLTDYQRRWAQNQITKEQSSFINYLIEHLDEDTIVINRYA